MHLLVTPDAKILYGADQPVLIAGESNYKITDRELAARDALIRDVLNNIAKVLGYDVRA